MQMQTEMVSDKCIQNPKDLLPVTDMPEHMHGKHFFSAINDISLMGPNYKTSMHFKPKPHREAQNKH